VRSEGPGRLRAPDPLEAVISFAVRPKTRNDEDKLGSSSPDDRRGPTLRFRKDPQTNEFILAGWGDPRRSAVEKLKRVYGVEWSCARRRSPTSRRSRGKPKRRGSTRSRRRSRQYGDCWIRLEPQPRGKGFEYVDGSWRIDPAPIHSGGEKGIVSDEQGVIAVPVVDVKATVFDAPSTMSIPPRWRSRSPVPSPSRSGAGRQTVLLEPIAEMRSSSGGERGTSSGPQRAPRPVLGVDASEEPDRPCQCRWRGPPLFVRSSFDHLRRGQFTMKVSHYEEIPPSSRRSDLGVEEGVGEEEEE